MIIFRAASKDADFSAESQRDTLVFLKAQEKHTGFMELHLVDMS